VASQAQDTARDAVGQARGQVRGQVDLRSTQLGNQVSAAVSAITRESASFHTISLATRVGAGGEDGVGDGLGERVQPARIRAETQRERL